MKYPNSITPLQSGGARRTLDKLIEKHGVKLFNCFEVGYSTFGGIQSIIFLPPFHKFAEINPKDATRPVTIAETEYRVAKIKDFTTLPETAQTAPNFFLYKFIEELVQHFDYGVGTPGVQSPEFSSNFPGLDAATKTKYDNDCFALLEITCRLYLIFYVTIYAQQDLCLENNMRSGLYSKYVESRTTQPQFSVFMDEITNALQSGEALQCLFGQNETNQDALEILLEMMLEHGLLYTAAKLGLPIEKIKVLTGTRFFTGTTDFLTKLKSGFPVAAGAPLPAAPVTNPGPGPGTSPKPPGPPQPPQPPPKPSDEQIKAVLTNLLYTGGDNLTWTRIPQSKVTAFIGGAGKLLNITSEIVNIVLKDKGTELGIPLIIFNDTTIVPKDSFDGPYDVPGDGWCFYYSILEQFTFERSGELKRTDTAVLKGKLEKEDSRFQVEQATKKNTLDHITDIKDTLLNPSYFPADAARWKAFYNSQPGKTDKSYDEYIESLDTKDPHVWADPEYGIGKAMANNILTTINIYQQTEGGYILLQTYPFENKNPPINILYINRNHYQILLVKPGVVLPPPPPGPPPPPPPPPPGPPPPFLSPPPTEELNVAAAHAAAAGKKSWIDNNELVKRYTAFNKEYLAKLTSANEELDRMNATFKDLQKPGAIRVPSDILDIFANASKKFKESTLLTETINTQRKQLIEGGNNKSMDEATATTILNKLEKDLQEYLRIHGEFVNLSQNFIREVDKKIKAAANAKRNADLAARRRANPALVAAEEAAGNAEAAAYTANLKADEALAEVNKKKVQVARGEATQAELEALAQKYNELRAEADRLKAVKEQKNKELNELKALQPASRGGTRKKRHHSYPLKHTFKNRRA